MTALKNDRILRVSRAQAVDKTPVWIMRQAGRYLPEFREERKKHDFFTICRTPELACTVTLQPIDRYDGLFDASIIFSDILVIPQAMGLEVQMLAEKGPHFPAPLRVPVDMQRLAAEVDVAVSLKYVFDAITLTRDRLAGRVPLFGFCGAPWTLMAYMIEGGGSKTLSYAKRWLTQYPAESAALLQRITDICAEYLFCQVKAGAQMLQLFDSWAGELPPDQYRRFSLPYCRHIASAVKAKCIAAQILAVPMTIFAKGAHFAIEDLLDSDYDVIAIDWTMEVRSVQRRVLAWMDADKEKRRQYVALQGNMDPIMLFAPEQTVASATKDMVETFLVDDAGKRIDNRIGYVCNLGHGILPETPVENVRVFLQSVAETSRDIFSRK